jgi:hypothetical protein
MDSVSGETLPADCASHHKAQNLGEHIVAFEYTSHSLLLRIWSTLSATLLFVVVLLRASIGETR